MAQAPVRAAFGATVEHGITKSTFELDLGMLLRLVSPQFSIVDVNRIAAMLIN